MDCFMEAVAFTVAFLPPHRRHACNPPIETIALSPRAASQSTSIGVATYIMDVSLSEEAPRMRRIAFPRDDAPRLAIYHEPPTEATSDTDPFEFCGRFFGRAGTLTVMTCGQYEAIPFARRPTAIKSLDGRAYVSFESSNQA